MIEPGEQVDPRGRRRNRIMILALFGIAAFTYLAAWLAQPLVGWLGSTNQGRLLDPMPSIASLPIIDSPSAAGFLREHKWRLMVAAESDCDTPCREALHQLRQLHVLLAQDAGRVRRALVLAGPVATPAVRTLAEQYPRLQIVQVSGFPRPLQPAVYVVDPLGNVVLEYAYAQAGKPLLTDLKKLLRVSRAG